MPGFHIDAMCEHLEACFTGEIRNLLITIPPRHAKSLTVSVMMPTWAWIFAPATKFLFSSYAMVLSKRDSVKSRRIIQSPWYQDRFGDKFKLTSDQNEKTRYDNDHTGYRIATSVGGTATGEGGDFVVADDAHNLEEIHSQVIREGVLGWWDDVMATRLNNPRTGVRIIIMQRGHKKDLAGHVMDQGGYTHLCLPAEFEGKKNATSIGWEDPRKKRGELLAPERFGPEQIKELKARLTPYAISGQLQQRPTPEEGGILKRKYFRLWPADKKLPAFHFIIQSYDTSYTESTMNDPNACTTWGLFKIKGAMHMMLLEAWSDWLEYPQLRAFVRKNKYSKYGEENNQKGVDLILIEKKGSGISLIQDLAALGIASAPYNPQKSDKITRANAVAPFGAAGFIWVIESEKRPGEAVAWAQPFLDQCTTFPNDDHDDYVDTFTQSVIYLRDHQLLEANIKLPEGVEEKEEEEYRPVRYNAYAA